MPRDSEVQQWRRSGVFPRGNGQFVAGEGLGKVDTGRLTGQTKRNVVTRPRIEASIRRLRRTLAREREVRALRGVEQKIHVVVADADLARERLFRNRGRRLYHRKPFASFEDLRCRQRFANPVRQRSRALRFRIYVDKSENARRQQVTG